MKALKAKLPGEKPGYLYFFDILGLMICQTPTRHCWPLSLAVLSHQAMKVSSASVAGQPGQDPSGRHPSTGSVPKMN